MFLRITTCYVLMQQEMTDKTPGAEHKEHGRWGGGGSLYEACLYGDENAEAQTQTPSESPAEASEEEAVAAAVRAAEAGVGMGSRARAVLSREQVRRVL